MNPFTDPQLSADCYSAPEHVDGNAIALFAGLIGAILSDPFDSIADGHRPGRWNRVESPGQIIEAFARPSGVLLRAASGNAVLDVVARSGLFTCARKPAIYTSIKMLFDAKATACAPRVMSAAETLCPYWGTVGSTASSIALTDQLDPNPQDRKPSPFGLPKLVPLQQLASTAHPLEIGWLNYWPSATCRLLDFPDPSRDAALLSRSRELPNGAWLVRLTDDPLDPAARPDHVRALAEAYARFPQIGGRDAPATPVRG